MPAWCAFSATARMARSFSSGIDEALVAPGNIVVHFNAEDVALLGVADNLFRIVGLQAVRPDAHVVGPILAGGELLGKAERSHQEQDANVSRRPKRQLHATG